MVLLAALLSYFYSRNITHTSGVSLSSLSLSTLYYCTSFSLFYVHRQQPLLT